ncbi:MAG: diadenylate cyclase [Phycisphaerales bacterium]|nr:MAG: diadenylate cyclase [Phycisphaerales bacterium]
MARKAKEAKMVRSDADLARMIVQVAQAVGADRVICGTETGVLFGHVKERGAGLSVVAATPNGDTYDALKRDGSDALRLSMRVANKYRQARHAVSMALNAGKVAVGDLVVCAVGHDLCHGGGDLVLITDVEANVAEVALSEMVRLTDGIRPSVMEVALRVACKIGMITRQGKPIGALFVLGDSDEVAKGSRQLILNPFHGHEDPDRMLTNPAIHQMLIELAKLDGAFIVRGDGLIRTAGAFLAAPKASVDVPAGLGARHTTAASVTCRTHATAVVVSATDGFVRAFSRGELVLQMDPEVPLGPIQSPGA